jgi:ADP-heptose:LPS heptosyltransferase
MFRVRHFVISFLKFIKFDIFFNKLKFYKRRLILFIDTFAINNKKEKNGVLLIRLDAIGDFIIWLDSAKEYRSNYPNQKITLLANSMWVELAKNISYWDEVIGIDVIKFKSNLIYRLDLIKQISNKGFLISIQPNFSRSLLLGDSIIRASCSDIKIGSVGDLNNIYLYEKIISDKWYTKLIQNSKIDQFELIRNSDFVSNVFNKPIQADVPFLPVYNISDKIVIPDKYFIISPGAAWVGRRWSIENFALVIGEIVTKYRLFPVLCGSKNEKELCQLIINKANLNALNLAGSTSLMQLVELIRDATFVLANESSSVHIATAVKTPSFCITGGGHFGRFVPYTIKTSEVLPIVINEDMECYFCNWNCSIIHNPKESVPCLNRVTPMKVINEINVLLS